MVFVSTLFQGSSMSSSKPLAAKTRAKTTTNTRKVKGISYSAKHLDPVKAHSHCLVVGCSEGLVLSPAAKAINEADAGQLLTLLKREVPGSRGTALA